MSKKPVIVFEGIEGSGKSYHISNVSRYLTKKKISHIKIREPGGNLNAEKIPEFSASPGLIQAYHAPGGLGIRVDSAIYSGYTVPPYYDSLICKLIVQGENRNEAIAKLQRALKELIVDGIDTTADLFSKITKDEEFIKGTYSISWLEYFLDKELNAT